MMESTVPASMFSLLVFVFLAEPYTAFGSVSKCDEDAFINLCGFCVGGSSGLQDSEGKDQCDLCFGSNDCLKCNNLGVDGCKTISYPKVFDLASAETEVKLYLKNSEVKENAGVICSVKRVEGATSDESAKIIPLLWDTTPYLQLDLSDLRSGSYMVVCKENISDAVEMKTELKIVDSRKIKIISVNESVKITSSIPFKVTLNISCPEDIQNFVCCIQSDGLRTASVASAKPVSGGVIECGPMVAYGSTAALIGVAGTLNAALERSSNLNRVELRISPSDPLIKRSTFSSDLRLIFIQFDQNINTSTDCSKALSPETISLFGKGWQCFIRADQIVIQLGSDPVIHPGSRISLASINDIQLSTSNSQGSTTIVDDITDQVVEPVYNVLAPHVACTDMQQPGYQASFFARKMQRDERKQTLPEHNSVTVLEVQPLGGQNLLYNWSVSFTPSNNRHPLSQRDMLMTWLSVRMLDKSVKTISSNRISLNNSLMLSNVDYTVTVRGTNALGISGEEKHIPVRLQEIKAARTELRSMSSENFPSACASGAPLDAMISSSPATFSDVDSRIEVSVSCCDGRMNSDVLGQVGYLWSIKSYNGTKINVGPFQGKYLNIPSGTFHGGERYKISCELFHKTLNITLGSASTSIVTLERGIKSNVNVSSVGISTRHPLIIDASSSVDLDNKQVALQFEWKCRIINTESEIFGYGDSQCYIPNQRRRLLHDAYAAAFKKSILHLPPGSLSIGRYQFSVQVSRISEVNKLISGVTTIEVSVLGGSPPLVFIPTRNSASNENSYLHVVNPDEGVTLTGLVTGIKAGCIIAWQGVDHPGYMPINESLLHTDAYMSITDFDKSREFSAELSPGLIGDAKYRFRLSALCPTQGNLSVETSFADLDVFTDAPPVVKPLFVEPLEGEALVTEFRFSTQPAYDDLLDYPLRYSFGFQILEEGNNPRAIKYFHSSSQKLSASTYLPATSLTVTKIQSVLRVCDIRQICRVVEGPLVMSNAPKELTAGHVELLSDGFSSFLTAEEYEDAIMLVESSMVTLEILDDKSLYQLASKKVEKAVNHQLDLFEKRLNSSPEEVNAALRFLKAANAALKHGAFTQETLQRLVAFKDKILGMLNEESKTMSDHQSSLRKRRDAQLDSEQPRNILQPEMVRTLLSVSEVAIFNLSDTGKALNEKQKLLHNVSFFMDALCRGLRNSVPLFIGSRVVSFSIQRLNIQIKYKDDLAIPDWRSSKSGGTPVNATAQIRLGEDVQQLFGGGIVCMGAAFYPLDILSEVTKVSIPGSFRQSSVYYIKIVENISQKVTASETYNDGLDVKKQTVKIKIPIWNDQMQSGAHLECWVWSHGTWDRHSCKFGKFATLINKPAVECLCSILGYHAVFAVESLPSTTSTEPVRIKTSTSPNEFPTTATSSIPVVPTIQDPSFPTEKTTITTVVSTKVQTVRATIGSRTTSSPVKDTSAAMPPGIPIPNTSKNFTFKIQEEYSAAVGTDEEAFISQLKRDILKQVEMPANMIASIELAPGSILVTLHLVDTDIRTVDDVLPSLAAVLQDGRLSVNGVDGRHLSVPPQKLKLLLHRSESSFVPWIIIGCSGFGLFSVGSLIIAAIIVKRQMRDLDFTNNSGSPEIINKTPSYGRFHLEQTLDGTEATLSRYRGSVNNPLVVSTIGGLASVMGTNALVSTDRLNTDSQFMLQLPQGDNRTMTSSLHQYRNSSNPSTSSGNTSGSSDNASINSIQKRIRNGSFGTRSPLPEGRGNYIDCEPDEEDSGIGLNARVTTGPPSHNGSQTPEAMLQGQHPPDVRILPGTPTGRDDDEPPSPGSN